MSSSASGGDGDDAAGAGGDFLDVGEGFFVFEDGAGVGGVFGGDADDGMVSSMGALGLCFLSPLAVIGCGGVGADAGVEVRGGVEAARRRVRTRVEAAELYGSGLPALGLVW